MSAPSCAYCLTKRGLGPVPQAQHVIGDEDLPAACRRRADADDGNVQRLGHPAGDRLDGALQHGGEGAGRLHRQRVRQHGVRLRVRAALGAEAAMAVHGLRLQPDMAEHGNAALHQESDRGGHLLPALQLDAAAPGFRHDPHGGAVGLHRGFAVAAERQVDDHAGQDAAPHHRGAVQHHHVHGHGQGAVQPVQHHADRVAHQQQVAMRVQRAGHRGGVGGQRHDRVAGP